MTMQRLQMGQVGLGPEIQPWNEIGVRNPFYTNNANFNTNPALRIGISRFSGRVGVGQGVNTFAYATAGNNPVLDAWVHGNGGGDDPSLVQYAQTQAGFSSIWQSGVAVAGAVTNRYGQGLGVAGWAKLQYTGAGAGDVNWGIYGEGIRGAGTQGFGSIWACELAIVNLMGDAENPLVQGGSPYKLGRAGQSLGLVIQSGGGREGFSYTADNPLVISNSDAMFYGGICIEDGTILGRGGGRPEGFMLPLGVSVAWHRPVLANQLPATTFSIHSSITEDGTPIEIAANDFGFNLRLINGQNLMRVVPGPNIVNHLIVRPSAATFPVVLEASGTDGLRFVASSYSSAIAGYPVYADQAAARADTALPLGREYVITGSDIKHIKRVQT